MDIISYELDRHDQWRNDLEKRKRHFENTTGLCLLPAMSPENSDKKIKIIDDMWSVDSPLEIQIKKRPDDECLDIDSAEIDRFKDDIEKSRKKFKTLTKKQEQLLKGL